MPFGLPFCEPLWEPTRSFLGRPLLFRRAGLASRPPFGLGDEARSKTRKTKYDDIDLRPVMFPYILRLLSSGAGPRMISPPAQGSRKHQRSIALLDGPVSTLRGGDGHLLMGCLS
jgi:hypothetical protein